MLNRRALKVSFIKDEKSSTPTLPETTFESKVALIGGHLNKIATKAGLVVVAYIAADTARKVLVAKATNS